ncbi:uncharacterized protein EI97DRAFT_352503, partial [Westerdykella ornata]
TPQPTLTPEQRLALEKQQSFERLGRAGAIAGVILCPTIALLPPRKLDLYTFSLGIGTYLSADYLLTSYTGRGIVHRITPKWMYGSSSPSPGFLSNLPTEKAVEMQQRLEKERRLKEAQEAIREGREFPAEQKKPRGVLQRFWMGDEEEGWQERRLEAESKALAEGKGISELILDQVWDVWNWDKKKGEG